MSKAEEFIQENTRNCSQLHYNSACTLRHCITPEQAKKAVEIAREEMINEICEWIKDNIEQYPVDNWDRFVNSLITDLKQAIKDK